MRDAASTPAAIPVILSIAGYDPSSGAGVTADVLTAAAHGCFAVTCPTALTVQNTTGVAGVESVAAGVVQKTLLTLVEDFDLSAVRIGMLGSAEVAVAVAEFLRAVRPTNIVLDPVLKSSSGAALLDAAGVAVLKDRLIPLIDLLTPNTAEAEVLTGITVSDSESQFRAAEAILRLGAKAVVVTGGHLPQAEDLLVWNDGHELRQQTFTAERIDSRNTHGTGCAFAASLACQLAKGESLPEAVAHAKEFVRNAIRSAPGLGKGHGPMNLTWPLIRK